MASEFTAAVITANLLLVTRKVVPRIKRTIRTIRIAARRRERRATRVEQTILGGSRMTMTMIIRQRIPEMTTTTIVARTRAHKSQKRVQTAKRTMVVGPMTTILLRGVRHGTVVMHGTTIRITREKSRLTGTAAMLGAAVRIIKANRMEATHSLGLQTVRIHCNQPTVTGRKTLFSNLIGNNHNHNINTNINERLRLCEDSCRRHMLLRTAFRSSFPPNINNRSPTNLHCTLSQHPLQNRTL